MCIFLKFSTGRAVASSEAIAPRTGSLEHLFSSIRCCLLILYPGASSFSIECAADRSSNIPCTMTNSKSPVVFHPSDSSFNNDKVSFVLSYSFTLNCKHWFSVLTGRGPVFLSTLLAGRSNTSVTVSHKLSTGIPSNLKPASNEIISASKLLCETAVCLLQVQHTGTNVLLPKMHSTPSDVDVESLRSLAKSASWKRLMCILVHCFPHDNAVCNHL